MPSVIIAVPYKPTAASLAAGLRARGHEVHAVTGAAEVLALLRFLTPAALVLDLSQRGMTGLQLLRVVRNDPRHEQLRVLVLSACKDRRETDAARALGAEILCRSTITAAEVADAVARAATVRTGCDG
jgi:CheY-like chemotaxis protein